MDHAWPGADVKVETRGTRAEAEWPEGGQHSGVPKWEPESRRGAQTTARPSPGGCVSARAH